MSAKDLGGEREVSTQNSGKSIIGEQEEEKLICDQFVESAKHKSPVWHTMLAQHYKWIQFRANLSRACADDLLNSLYKTQLVPD